LKYRLKIRIYDVIIIVSILAVAAVSYYVIQITGGKTPNDIVEVRQRDHIIFRLTKDEINQDGFYEFQFDKGTAKLEVKDKKVRMLPMDRSICPQAICSETGWIDGKPKSIVCIPNLLIVSFAGDQKSDVDVISN